MRKPIEVRCCCDTRLLGYVDMDVPPLHTSVILAGLPFAYTNYECRGALRGPALKSNDYAEEALRRIPGFKPASFEQRVQDAEELL